MFKKKISNPKNSFLTQGFIFYNIRGSTYYSSNMQSIYTNTFRLRHGFESFQFGGYKICLKRK